MNEATDIQTEKKQGDCSRSATGSATRRQITLGAFAPPLVEQLKGLANKKDLRTCDLLSRAISMLKIQGVLSDRESSNARRRLVKRIERTLIVSPNVEHIHPEPTPQDNE